MDKRTENFNLEKYLSSSVENIVKQFIKSSVFHPQESLFMARYALACKRADVLRKEAEKRGEHIPPFLIASITSMCNLHCVGCYARSVKSCVDGEAVNQLSAEEWERVFKEAKDMGIVFILLAGGEPMVRKDVILKASQFPEILFPVITNGTMINGEYLDLFDKYRNLVPVLSIEGGQGKTDSRRGDGMYEMLQSVMDKMTQKGIAFGVSVTVTSENLLEVTSDSFVDQLSEKGCKAIIYVEFVPTHENLNSLALDDKGRETLDNRLTELRSRENSLMMISFPGDEKNSGGCLAAGRGFFHINPSGGAEPCPFSPYSDMSVKNHSLKEVMKSELFNNLRDEGFLNQPHNGGCVLYGQGKQVEALLKK